MILKQLSTFLIILLSFIACTNQTIKDKMPTQPEDRYVSASELNPKYDESKIHGIGIFKLGKSIDSTIKNPIFTKIYTLDTIGKDKSKEEREGQRFIFFVPHPKSANHELDALDQKNWCKNKTVYVMPWYTVDSVKIPFVTLTYYNNILVSVCVGDYFYVYNSILAKYGKADKEYESYENGYRLIRQWHNQDITAELHDNADDNSFKVEINNVMEMINLCDEDEFNLQDSILKTKQKSKLKNF